jgi:hypothetical protein
LHRGTYPGVGVPELSFTSGKLRTPAACHNAIQKIAAPFQVYNVIDKEIGSPQNCNFELLQQKVVQFLGHCKF